MGPARDLGQRRAKGGDQSWTTFAVLVAGLLAVGVAFVASFARANICQRLWLLYASSFLPASHP
jgi:hypothetical protein